MGPCKIRSKVMVYDTDPLVREHRVQDMHILPGVSLLDTVYKTLVAARYPTESVVLQNVLFHEPVVTHAEMDRKVTVVVVLEDESGRVTISSLPWRDDRVLSDEATVHMSCDIALVDALPLEPLPPASFDQAEDLDCCYHVTRHIGIYHDSFMQCLGTVALQPSGEWIGSAALGPRAAARNREFVLHPVFLDCATIVPLFPWRDRLETASLFMPFAIEAFCARPLTGKSAVLVRVRQPDAAEAEREILHHSFDLYDVHGEPLARFKKFAVKRVRSLENVRRLLTSGRSARSAVPVVPVAAAVVPPTGPAAPKAAAGADMLVALIVTHIERCGQLRWNPADVQKPFFDLGLDSLVLLEISEALEKALQVRLYPTLLFEHASVAALAAYLRETFPEQTNTLTGTGGVAPAQPHTAPVAAPAPAAVSVPQRTPDVLVPRWRPVCVDAPGGSSTVALLGERSEEATLAGLAKRLGTRVCYRSVAGAHQSYLDDFRRILGEGLSCDEIWLVGADHASAFTLLRILLQAGRMQQPLVLRALTRSAYSIHGEAPALATGHGVWGLWQTVSREYPQVSVFVVDVDDIACASLQEDGETAWLDALPRLHAPSRCLLAMRDGRYYERCLYRTARAALPARSPLRQGGCYLVIGGAGGVGMAWVRYLRQSYGARVAVMGRRPLDQVQTVLMAAGEVGRDVLYFQGAVDDETQLARICEAVRTQFGALHGIVHAAMVLDDKRLADMSEADFQRVLQPKVAGAQALASVTENMPLDFLLFFSSVQSFVGNLSQGNYAAASTFLDGFAAALQARRPYPVTVVNWGFWSEVGAVATDVYRHLLARQGMHGLRTDAALAALEQVLAAGWAQALIVAAEEPVLRDMGLSQEYVLERRGAAALPVSTVPLDVAAIDWEASRRMFTEAEAAMVALMSVARRRVAHVLREIEITDPETAKAAVRSGRLAREHHALVRAVLDTLERASVGPADGLAAPQCDIALTQLASTAPVLRHLVPLLQACLAAYPDILGGRRPAMEVMFPGGCIDLVQAVYGQSCISLFYNQLMAHAVSTFAAGQPERVLRVLEIGAGTGATSVEVLDTLRAAGIACEYWYTDLWDKLVTQAQQHLGERYPEMRFGFLDIGSDPYAQGVCEQFDVVVATNVLHATRDLRSALRHAKLLLRRGGALVLNESVQVQEYSTYTFGLLPGWWSATDAQERLPGAPLASRSVWMRLLRDAGYVHTHMLVPTEEHATALGAQEVFCALSDGEVWLSARAVAAPMTTPDSAWPPALTGQLQPLPAALCAGLPAPRYVRLYTDQRDHIWLFLDNPPANTFTVALLDELCTVLECLGAQTEQCGGRLIYLSHCGGYFSLGGDRNQLLELLAAGRHDALHAFAEKACRLLRLLATVDALVVAVVDGTAQGGGLETLLAADLQFVRDGVKLGLPEIKSGLVPGMGGLTYLRHQIGMARTKRLVLCGDLISAREAYEAGLISHVVEDPYSAALAFGDQIEHLETARYAKRLLGHQVTEQLTADIDAWLHYLLHHAQWIDVQRIADAQAVLNAQVTMIKSKEHAL